MDCILIQHGRAHQIWPDTTKAALCYRLYEGEQAPRPIFSQEVIDAIVEVESGTVQSGDVWDGASFSTPAQAEPVPVSISDRQFFQQLAIAGAISQAEALDAVKTGAIPSALAVVVQAMPEADRFNAEMLLSGATVFLRAHPMTEALRAALGWSAEQTDDLWRAAALL